MKRLYLKISGALIGSLVFSVFSFSQSTNPAEASGYEGDGQEFWDNTPHMILTPESEITILPVEVDNSLLMYFPRRINPQTGEIERQIYIQNGNGACAAVSTVHYTLTYELNRLRELYGLYEENKYPANFTWNFLNYGSYNQGSSFKDNLDILIQNGSPNCVDFGNCDPADYTRWMHGYEKYHNSHNNRISGYSQISPIYNPDNLVLMKHWLAHHNEGAETGGLIVFSTEGACTGTVNLPSQSAHAGEIAVVEWGTACNHAMTIVGYCDDIKWDFNGDGQLTNDIDLDGNGIIDVRDYEIGAFIVVGLGHYDYAQSGFVWVMYKTMAECTNQSVIVEHATENNPPKFEIKGMVTSNERKRLTFKIGKGDHANSGIPPFPGSWKEAIFSNVGGSNPIPMQGLGMDPWMEYSIDFYGHFAPTVEFGKIFVKLTNNPYANDNCTLDYWSIVDRRWNEVFELTYPVENTIIPPGTTVTYGIPYDLIPHETDIEEDLTLSSDMVSRFFPTVSNGAILTIEDGVNIDMYNSEISINPGSSLIIEDDVTFIAKKGICKIRVDGNLSTGSNVSFHAEEGAQLWLTIYNNDLNLTFENASFINTALIAYNNSNTIHQSTFENSGVYGFKGNLHITNSDFTGSFVKASDASQANRIVRVEYCNFYGSSSTAAIDINNYPDFQIKNNVINDGAGGISLFYSGSGRHHVVSNNWIMGNYLTGITSYYTRVDIIHNVIANNSYGIKCLDRSSVHIEGD
ncbi:MAG: hypothetical protein ACNA7V_10350, partial [Bacteroidales bacterium]